MRLSRLILVIALLGGVVAASACGEGADAAGAGADAARLRREARARLADLQDRVDEAFGP